MEQIHFIPISIFCFYYLYSNVDMRDSNDSLIINICSFNGVCN